MATARIHAEKFPWGVRLAMVPLSEFPMMLITAEIQLPNRSYKRPTVSYTFSGTPFRERLKGVHLTTYSDAINRMIQTAAAMCTELNGRLARGAKAKPRMSKLAKAKLAKAK